MGVRKRKVCERLIAVLLGLAMILSLLPLDAKIVQAATLPADGLHQRLSPGTGRIVCCRL